MEKPTTHSQDLSVIIPTMNRGEILYSTIKQVLAQQGCAFELIIVDQSDDPMAIDNRSFVENVHDPRITYLWVDRKNLPNARNIGIGQASAPIILFLDDDVILLRDNFLTAHLAAFEDDEVGGATGRSVERTMISNARRTSCHVSLGGRTIVNLMGLEQQTIGTCKGSNMSFRAKVFEAIGGFDRRTELLEDADFSVRVSKAGWKLLFLPEAELLHLSAASGGVRLGGALQTERCRFRSTAYYILKHRGWLGFVPFLTTFFLIASFRVWRFRSPGVFFSLMREIGTGYKSWMAGADQELRLSR
jgi:GT2 family glycosyltransferase